MFKFYMSINSELTIMIELKNLIPEIIKSGSNCILNTKVPNFKTESFNNLKLATLNHDTFHKTKGVSAKGIMFEEYGRVYNRDWTSFLRKDIKWTELGKYFTEKYCSTPKVNVYQAAASKGDESYTLSLLLKKCFGVNSNKVFPINAFDINNEVIQKNINRQKNDSDYFIHISDFRRLTSEFHLYEDGNQEYFKVPDDGFWVRLKSNILKTVEFKHSNILDEVHNFNDKNPSILLCRNMWPYVDEKYYDEFAQNAYNKLADNSCILIGDFDNTPEIKGQALIKDSFKKFGFKETDIARPNYSPGPILFEK